MDPKQWSEDVHSLRAIVEMSIALVKRYRLAKEFCRLSVAKQVLALKVIYQLVHRSYKNFPLRAFPPHEWINAAQMIQADVL
jgi:hypothetical protein